MKPRKRASPRLRVPSRVPNDVQPTPEPPRHSRVDWSEPAEPERPEPYDIERDGVAPEIGPDEAEVDRRLEH